LLGDVGLHVLLALEDGVEQAPPDEGVRQGGLEEVEHEARAGLIDRHEDRAALEALRVRGSTRPRAGPGPALERRLVRDLGRAVGLDLDARLAGERDVAQPVRSSTVATSDAKPPSMKYPPRGTWIVTLGTSSS